MQKDIILYTKYLSADGLEFYRIDLIRVVTKNDNDTTGKLQAIVEGNINTCTRKIFRL